MHVSCSARVKQLRGTVWTESSRSQLRSLPLPLFSPPFRSYTGKLYPGLSSFSTVCRDTNYSSSKNQVQTGPDTIEFAMVSSWWKDEQATSRSTRWRAIKRSIDVKFVSLLFAFARLLKSWKWRLSQSFNFFKYRLNLHNFSACYFSTLPPIKWWCLSSNRIFPSSDLSSFRQLWFCISSVVQRSGQTCARRRKKNSNFSSGKCGRSSETVRARRHEHYGRAIYRYYRWPVWISFRSRVIAKRQSSLVICLPVSLSWTRRCTVASAGINARVTRRYLHRNNYCRVGQDASDPCTVPPPCPPRAWSWSTSNETHPQGQWKSPGDTARDSWSQINSRD